MAAARRVIELDAARRPARDVVRARAESNLLAGTRAAQSFVRISGGGRAARGGNMIRTEARTYGTCTTRARAVIPFAATRVRRVVRFIGYFADEIFSLIDENARNDEIDKLPAV